MNYLESKVKELFEQVLRGEKRVPKLVTVKVKDKEGYHMNFSDNLSIVKGNWLRVIIQDEGVFLFEDEYKEYMKPRKEEKVNEDIIIFTRERPKISEDRLELELLFQEVWEYSSKISNDKWLIDRIFGELE
jgi:hypothetical protein